MRLYRSSIRRVITKPKPKPWMPAAGAILTRPVQSPGLLKPRAPDRKVQR